MSKQSQITEMESGNPPSPDAGIFGFNLTFEESRIVLLPVPWDSTASYHKGTALAPSAIVKASHQLDLFDLDFGKTYAAGICMLPVEEGFPYVTCAEPALINSASEKINNLIYKRSQTLLKTKKFVGVIGGEHSAPYGLVKALCDVHKSFGILHIDAHHDLRVAYEGYQHSHASIMYNLINDFPNIERLTSVGIRDFSHDEFKFANNNNRIQTFYDVEVFEKRATGKSFHELASLIISSLPKKVYISFDIDGLDPRYCPGTGTPVPGGLEFAEACYLLNMLAKSDRQIIGFDLCEVAPTANDREWNSNVGARIVYKLCGAMCYSNKLIES